MTIDLTTVREHYEHYTAAHDHVGAFACCTAHGSADDVPALLAEVERLRSALDKIRDLHEGSVGHVCPSCANFAAEYGGDPFVAHPCPTARVIQEVAR